MIKYFILIFPISSLLFCCGQTNENQNVDGITFDSSIESEVEKKISNSEFGTEQSKILIYNNLMLVDFFENDKLIVSTKEQDDKMSVFKSFYYWSGDTLGIDGAFGLFGGVGFTIKIVNNKATLYHMLASDEFPSYSYSENGKLIYRLEIPCSETKIVLSEIPDQSEKQTIYGYVEFKSADYFASSGSADGQEIMPRKKQRANMKIYFKSAYLEF